MTADDALFDVPAPIEIEGGRDGGATIDPTGRYRYDLWRFLHPGLPWLGVVMLNPSTADATKLDPTLRRVLGYARTLEFGGVRVRNLFALRTTDPAGLRDADDPIGPDNDEWLKRLTTEVDTVVVAWGTGRYPRLGTPERWEQVAALLAPAHPMCLATAKDGQPRHPLYLKADLKLKPWSAPHDATTGDRHGLHRG